MNRTMGILQIGLSGFSFGFLGLFGKLAFANDLSIGELLTYRFAAATFIMAFGLACLSPRRLQISRRDLLICAGLGLFGYAVFSTFYFAAIRGVSIAMASLLLYTYPVLVAIGARFAFKERLSRAQLIALPVAVFGLVILLANGDLHAKPLAVLSGLASAACYAGYILVSSKFQKTIDPLTSAFYVMLFATLGLAMFHHPDVTKLAHATPTQAATILGIAVICTVTPLVLFLSGLQKLGNTEASLLSTIEPVTAAFLGAIVLREPLELHTALGGALVLAALAIIVTQRKPAEALE